MFYNHGIFIDIMSRSDPSGAFSLVPYSRKHTCLFIECHSISIFARQNTFWALHIFPVLIQKCKDRLLFTYCVAFVDNVSFYAGKYSRHIPFWLLSSCLNCFMFCFGCHVTCYSCPWKSATLCKLCFIFQIY